METNNVVLDFLSYLLPDINIEQTANIPSTESYMGQSATFAHLEELIVCSRIRDDNWKRMLVHPGWEFMLPATTRSVYIRFDNTEWPPI